MTCAVKLLLLVAAVAIGSNTEIGSDLVDGSNSIPVAKECDGLNKTLPRDELHQIVGDWVLVWSVTDNEKYWDDYSNISTSHVEMRLRPDNTTIWFHERNLFLDKSCVTFILNMSSSDPAPSDPALNMSASDPDPAHHTLYTISATMEKAGVVEPYDDSGVVDVYESSSDALVLVYTNKDGRYLLIYRREGHHSDMEQLKAAHSDHEKRGECLGFPVNRTLTYDGVADFCHKRSSTKVKQEEDKSCVTFILNMSSSDPAPSDPALNMSSSDPAPSDPALNMSASDPDPAHHTLYTISATMEKAGVVEPYDDSGVVDVYESSSDALVLVYTNKDGRYLLIYRREGHHSDMEQLKAAHSDHEKRGECLGFPVNRTLTYDGVADFCHKRSSTKVKQEES
ncbi:saxitoxin and tetrodotoxin-binding protein 2 [Scophthalmus maximus]|uniref:saxitoxin and tetrodotoxin-binding protein 2 n=1 Tax=Scophthalmus maximus TaxID=52904 RepID=UPI001FA8D28E|nr:saxitoxin and tetrodotoxin-binding protein 2 [Scophthalmus maximus]